MRVCGLDLLDRRRLPDGSDGVGGGGGQRRKCRHHFKHSSEGQSERFLSSELFRSCQ